MKAIFIAGTDTGAGKSVVTGLLAGYMLKRGRRVVTQKWVQTGAESHAMDIDIHLRIMRKTRNSFSGYATSMTPYLFKLAASPHLAAREENTRIDINKIKRCFKELSSDFDCVIVEGSGGLLVPLNKKVLTIDVIKELRLPVLLVAANRLGAINSTLLSIEAMRSRKIKIIGVVFNNVSKNENKLILKDSPGIVKLLGGVRVSGVLPYSEKIESLRKPFVRIAKEIEKRLL